MAGVQWDGERGGVKSKYLWMLIRKRWEGAEGIGLSPHCGPELGGIHNMTSESCSQSSRKPGSPVSAAQLGAPAQGIQVLGFEKVVP